MIKENLGKRIAELRKSLGISQEELAEKLDISQKSLSKIETGKNFLTSETLEKLSDALSISLTDLFDFEHLNDEEMLLQDIINHIYKIKKNNEKMKLLYKITKALTQM